MSSGTAQFHAGPHKLSGGGLESMGKSNSKLKPEVVEDLTRKTYCKYFLIALLKIKALKAPVMPLKNHYLFLV